MDKWTYRYLVTRDLMLFALAIESLSLYPTNPTIFIIAAPTAMASLVHVLEIANSRE
jgi:hypothetical protein